VLPGSPGGSPGTAVAAQGLAVHISAVLAIVAGVSATLITAGPVPALAGPGVLAAI
jgi:hypothetical protein